MNKKIFPIEKERFLFWITIFSLASIPATIITYIFTEMNITTIIVCYIFLIILSIILSIKSIYIKIENANEYLFYNNNEHDITCHLCKTKINTSEELNKHKIICNGYLQIN